MTGPLSVDQAMINKLVEIVLANLGNENFSVEMLAVEAGMSRTTCHRKVKSNTGKSVSQFIREIRLHKASEMLQNNEGNISEIAFKVGFGSSTYFIKCFHDYYGFPPGEVRKLDSGELLNYQTSENRIHDENKELILKSEIKSIFKRIKQKNILITSLSIVCLLLIINYILNPLEPHEKSIAVLPFTNDSPDTTNLYFTNGIMERITENLQKIRELRVISRSSSEKYRDNKTKTLSEIAKELGVNYIIEGSSQKNENSFSLVVRLISTSGKEQQLWTKSYNLIIKVTDDIYRLESDIAQRIAGELKAVISPDEEELIKKVPTASLTADDFYQRGREAFSKYWIGNNKSSLKEAKKYYKKALDYDSTFAQAYAGLARVYMHENHNDTFYSEDFLDSVLILSNIALSFNDKVEDAYITRGDYFMEKGAGDKATQDYFKAIQINPNSWEAYYKMPIEDVLIGTENLLKAASLNRGKELPSILRKLAFVLGRLGGFQDQARNYLLEALALDGDSASYYAQLAGFERSQGNFTKCIDYLLKSYSIDSSNTFALIQLGQDYGLIGQYKEALKYMRIYLDRQQNPLVTRIMRGEHRIGYALWQNGYRKEGKFYFTKQLESCLSEIELGRHSGIDELLDYYDVAAIYAFFGEKDKAYFNLKKYNKKKYIYQGMLTWIKTDPLFNNIRNEPEFQHIVNDQEARYELEHERIRQWLELQGIP